MGGSLSVSHKRTTILVSNIGYEGQLIIVLVSREPPSHQQGKLNSKRQSSKPLNKYKEGPFHSLNWISEFSPDFGLILTWGSSRPCLRVILPWWRSFLGGVGSFLLWGVLTWWRSFLGGVGSFLLEGVLYLAMVGWWVVSGLERCWPP